MPNAENANIRDVILQGVYEENLAMSAPHVKPARSGWHPGFRFITRILSVFLITVVVVLIQFVADPINQQSTNPVAFSEMASILPWAEIVHDQRVASFTVQQPSYLADSTSWPVTPFNAQRLLDYNLLLNHDQVRLSSVFGLDVQTIVIDPGHGGRDPGAIGSHGTREKDIVLDIALRLRDQLMQSGQYMVLLTRDTDTFMSLADRVQFTNLNPIIIEYL